MGDRPEGGRVRVDTRGQLLAAAALGLGAWPLALHAPAHLRAPLALALLLVQTLVEAVVAPTYLRRQLAHFGAPSARLPTVEHGASRASRLRVGATVLFALVLRALLVAIVLGPPLLAGRLGAERWVDSLSIPLVVAFGAAYVTGKVVTALASRAGLSEPSPARALHRALQLARRTWPALLGAHAVLAASGAAVALAPHLPTLFIVAMASRWLGDLLLSRTFARAELSAPAGPMAASGPRRHGFAAAALFVLGAFTSADVASAGELVTPESSETASGGTAPAKGSATTDGGDDTKLVKPTDIKLKPEEVRKVELRKAFDQANLELSQAEVRKAAADKELAAARTAALLPHPQQSPDFVEPDDQRRLRFQRLDAANAESTAADKLVADKQAAVQKTGQAVLDDAYGGQYGSLARNWIDFKNTGPYVHGLLEGAPQGVVDTVKGAYNAIAGPSTAAPTPQQLAEAGALDRQNALDRELLRIQDGSLANRLDGREDGAKILGPAVLAETGLGALRLGSAAVRAGASRLTAEEGAANALTKTESAALTQCFAAGTEIATPGGLQPIEDVRAGDEVLTRDPETGETRVEHVAQTFVRSSPVVDLVLEDESGRSEHIVVTQEHPFHVPDGSFRGVAELAPDDRVDALSGTARVVSLQALSETTTVYNFEVENAHTYFVGETGAWVHNACNIPDGFSLVKGEYAHGQKVYSNGKVFISRDVDAHNGGEWKLASSPRALLSKSTRTGTFVYRDGQLVRIGD